MTIYLGNIDQPNKAGKELLFDAIAAKAGVTINRAAYSLSEPQAVTTPGTAYNTVAYIGPVAASGYYGTKRVYYNRIHASKLNPITVRWENETKLSELLPKINALKGVFIEPVDIQDVDLPAKDPSKTEIKVTLTFKPESYLYYSSREITLGTVDPATQRPTYLPAGAVIDTWCAGVDQYSIIADGSGSATKKKEANHPNCVTAPTINRITLKKATQSNQRFAAISAGIYIKHIENQIAREGETVKIHYALTRPIPEDLAIFISFNWGTVVPADLSNLVMHNSDGTYANSRVLYLRPAAGYPLRFKAGSTQVAVSFPIKKDNWTEQDETFTVTASMPIDAPTIASAISYIRNTDPIVATITVKANNT